MAEFPLRVVKVAGANAAPDGEFFDEFQPLSLRWREPGMTYVWINRNEQMVSTRRRQGWEICSLERDFLSKGCPKDALPGHGSPDGEIHFGDLILGKMPIELWEKRQIRLRAKVRAKQRGYVERPQDEGEKVASQLRRQIPGIGRSIVYKPGENERRGYPREGTGRRV